MEDAADISSPPQYKEFGAPYTTEVIRSMGGAFIHHHSMAPHQYKNIANLEGLTVEQISSDPNQKRPPTDLEFVLSQVGDTAVQLECTPKEVYDYIEEMKQGRFLLIVSCKEKEEAEEVVAFVRKKF